MSLFDSQGAPAAQASNHPSEPPSLLHSTVASMSDAPNALNNPTSAIDPHHDARAIVRLIQCTQCSLLLRNPLTLPCGNSLCKTCLPELHVRPSIQFPIGITKEEGFMCPFKTCGKDHSIDDCSQDVTLAKVLDRVSIEVARYRPLTTDTPTLLDERPHWKNIIDSSKEPRYPASKVLNGGRLVATYTMAETGELQYDSEVAYQTMSPTGDSYEHLDTAMLTYLKEATKSELDCHVCYGLILDPLTTTCGHTFCRKCVARVLDHSTMCPICRRVLPMPPRLDQVASNQTLNKLLGGLCPDLVAARQEVAKQEEAALLGSKNMPLFVCSLAYPSMPCFLHIFEPRYRLMIRRAIESGESKFGMIMYNRRNEPQGELGNVSFMLYGTLLSVHSMQLMPDGRSLIETRGLSRFRVKDHGLLDGYMVGDIERIDDIPWEQEEQIEALETSGPAALPTDKLGQLNQMPTLELLKIGTDFITRMQAASAPWLHARVLHSYGPPPTDPALFPYWFASILPIADDEKYKLIPMTSIRQRLKLCATWVRRIEAQRW